MKNHNKKPPSPPGTYSAGPIEKHFPLVMQWAKHYQMKCPGSELQELVNEAKYGLNEAYKRYNGSTRISYFAGIYIQKYLNLFARSHYKKINHECSCLDEEENYYEFPDHKAESSLWNRIARGDIGIIFKKAKLTDREIFVLCHHWGINTGKKTHGQIGEMLGVSYEWSRQLEQKAMSKMKTYLIRSNSL